MLNAVAAVVVFVVCSTRLFLFIERSCHDSCVFFLSIRSDDICYNSTHDEFKSIRGNGVYPTAHHIVTKSPDVGQWPYLCKAHISMSMKRSSL